FTTSRRPATTWRRFSSTSFFTCEAARGRRQLKLDRHQPRSDGAVARASTRPPRADLRTQAGRFIEQLDGCRVRRSLRLVIDVDGNSRRLADLGTDELVRERKQI